MVKHEAEAMRRIGIQMLCAAGASPDEACVVMEELIETSLMGLDSHGIIRLAQYVRQIKDGSLRPGGQPRVVKQTQTTAVVDGAMTFGMITARFMTDHVMQTAREHHLAAAVSRHTHHVGRLGSFVQRLAEAGLFGLAVANSSRQGHYVVPVGGIRGRLGTNPLAYGCPNDGQPIVFDMSTSMIAEGAIRSAMQKGESIPADCVLDPEGKPTTDPKEFYRDAGGAIMPFGGRQGYKGFGLGLLVELLGATLAGAAVAADDNDASYINGFFILAINPAGFGAGDQFQELVSELSHYVKSAADEGGRVILPGDREWETREERLRCGIPIADDTWHQLCEAARSVGMSLSRERASGSSAAVTPVDRGG